MAHQSLYRRYRPRRFSEVRGQEHLVSALRNAVVGAGLIGRRDAELIRASAECELAALVDPTPASEKLAGELGEVGR